MVTVVSSDDDDDDWSLTDQLVPANGAEASQERGADLSQQRAASGRGSPQGTHATLLCFIFLSSLPGVETTF